MDESAGWTKNSCYQKNIRVSMCSDNGKVKWAEYLVKAQPKQQKWLWPQRIPANELTLIAGIQGMGKSLLTAKLSYHITTGTSWPDKSKCPIGDVILLQAEDSIEQTVRPRFDAAGADPSRVYFIRGIPGPKEVGLVPLEISDKFGFRRIIEAIKVTNNPIAIIVDPLGSYIGSIDIHRENQVRNVMFKLKNQIAEKYGIAILIVVHLRKGGSDEPALTRILGSVAFTGAARAVWGVAHDKDDPSRRMFLPMKHNLTSGKTPGMDFFINTSPLNGQGVVTWGKEIDDNADDAMQNHGNRPHIQLKKATDILTEMLSGGSQDVKNIKERMHEDEVSWRTACKAKVDLGINSVKLGSKWIWVLPKKE